MTPTACVACGEAFAADATRCDVPGNYGNSQRCVPCDLVNQANIADSYAHMGWHDEATGDVRNPTIGGASFRRENGVVASL
mmetsp:Transcript_34187/g.105027  ORF Transcript_34187/g.105027 Transcript_34187/m.105027 type:complete len:81 (+) Transcript_34187:223-465(+)